MSLRLRDTLPRQVRPVEPLDPGLVRIYSCGPTVYRFAHVGNLRTFLLADLIRRALVYHGLRVLHVQNITDVGHMRDDDVDRGEDRMLVAAGLEGRSTAEIADAYEAAFHADAALLNLLPAHVYPRATEHIREMVELAERLEDLGHAYRSTSGNLYYSVASFPGYGRLSGNTLDRLRAGHRSDVEPDKRDPADFALWKAAPHGRSLSWPTRRWGEGFPGWHLECSAMALRHLGPRFDIHTGGEDNVFPHHEDEIAQSAPVVGGVPATLWVHGAHLLMDGRKMAKSAGNFQRITELGDEGVDPLAFRYLCLTSRYARKLDYSDASIAGAAAALRAFRERVEALGPPPATGPWAAPPALRGGAAPARPVGLADRVAGHGDDPAGAAYPLEDRASAATAPLSDRGRAFHRAFVEAVDDDLDVPRALSVVRRILASDLDPDERRWLVLDADAILGLDLDLVGADGDDRGPDGRVMSSPAIDRLVRERTEARSTRDFARADRLRDDLRELGVDPVDQADGTTTLRRAR